MSLFRDWAYFVWWHVGRWLNKDAPVTEPPTSADPVPPAPAPVEGFAVTVIDYFHRTDPDEQITISGFSTHDEAHAYAVRRVRSSIEQFREPDQSTEDLHRVWSRMGEEVLLDGRYVGMANFELFAAKPATAEERDYLSLTPGGHPLKK